MDYLIKDAATKQTTRMSLYFFMVFISQKLITNYVKLTVRILTIFLSVISSHRIEILIIVDS